MSAVEPMFPSVPPTPAIRVVEASQVIETVGVEVLENAPDAVAVDLKKTAQANDVIPFASTLRRVG